MSKKIPKSTSELQREIISLPMRIQLKFAEVYEILTKGVYYHTVIKGKKLSDGLKLCKKYGCCVSIRLGLRYRAIFVLDHGYRPLWVGSHSDYDKIVS